MQVERDGDAALARHAPSLAHVLGEVHVVGAEAHVAPRCGDRRPRRRSRARPRASRRRAASAAATSLTAGPSAGPSARKFGLACQRPNDSADSAKTTRCTLSSSATTSSSGSRPAKLPGRCTTASASGWRTRVFVVGAHGAPEARRSTAPPPSPRRARRRSRPRRPTDSRRGAPTPGGRRGRPRGCATALGDERGEGREQRRDRDEALVAACGTPAARRRSPRRPGSRTDAASGARTSSTGRRRSARCGGPRRWRRRHRGRRGRHAPCRASCDSTHRSSRGRSATGGAGRRGSNPSAFA